MVLGYTLKPRQMPKSLSQEIPYIALFSRSFSKKIHAVNYFVPFNYRKPVKLEKLFSHLKNQINYRYTIHKQTHLGFYLSKKQTFQTKNIYWFITNEIRCKAKRISPTSKSKLGENFVHFPKILCTTVSQTFPFHVFLNCFSCCMLQNYIFKRIKIRPREL